MTTGGSGIDSTGGRSMEKVIADAREIEEQFAAANRAATVRVDDLELLLDRVVYGDGGSLPGWTPDRLEKIDADVLEAVARCLRAIEAAR